MTNDAVRTKAKRDQAWAAMREMADDIMRIANGGITPTEVDAKIVQSVFNCVMGDLHMMAAVEGDVEDIV